MLFLKEVSELRCRNEDGQTCFQPWREKDCESNVGPTCWSGFQKANSRIRVSKMIDAMGQPGGW